MLRLNLWYLYHLESMIYLDSVSSLVKKSVNCAEENSRKKWRQPWVLSDSEAKEGASPANKTTNTNNNKTNKQTKNKTNKTKKQKQKTNTHFLEKKQYKKTKNRTKNS